MTVDVCVRRGVTVMWVLVDGLCKVWLLVMPAVDGVIAWGRGRRGVVMVVVVYGGVCRARVREGRVDGGGRRVSSGRGPVLEMAEGLDWRPRRSVSGRSSWGHFFSRLSGKAESSKSDV